MSCPGLLSQGDAIKPLQRHACPPRRWLCRAPGPHLCPDRATPAPARAAPLAASAAAAAATRRRARSSARAETGRGPASGPEARPEDGRGHEAGFGAGADAGVLRLLLAAGDGDSCRVPVSTRYQARCGSPAATTTWAEIRGVRTPEVPQLALRKNPGRCQARCGSPAAVATWPSRSAPSTRRDCHARDPTLESPPSQKAYAHLLATPRLLVAGTSAQPDAAPLARSPARQGAQHLPCKKPYQAQHLPADSGLGDRLGGERGQHALGQAGREAAGQAQDERQLAAQRRQRACVAGARAARGPAGGMHASAPMPRGARGARRAQARQRVRAARRAQGRHAARQLLACVRAASAGAIESLGCRHACRPRALGWSLAGAVRGVRRARVGRHGQSRGGQHTGACRAGRLSSPGLCLAGNATRRIRAVRTCWPPVWKACSGPSGSRACSRGTLNRPQVAVLGKRCLRPAARRRRSRSDAAVYASRDLFICCWCGVSCGCQGCSSRSCCRTAGLRQGCGTPLAARATGQDAGYDGLRPGRGCSERHKLGDAREQQPRAHGQLCAVQPPQRGQTRLRSRTRSLCSGWSRHLPQSTVLVQ